MTVVLAGLALEDGWAGCGDGCEQGPGGFGKDEGAVHGFAPVEAIAPGDGAHGPEDVAVGCDEFLPETASTHIIVALLGREHGGYDKNHTTNQAR